MNKNTLSFKTILSFLIAAGAPAAANSNSKDTSLNDQEATEIVRSLAQEVSAENAVVLSGLLSKQVRFADLDAESIQRLENEIKIIKMKLNLRKSGIVMSVE